MLGIQCDNNNNRHNNNISNTQIIAIIMMTYTEKDITSIYKKSDSHNI